MLQIKLSLIGLRWMAIKIYQKNFRLTGKQQYTQELIEHNLSLEIQFNMQWVDHE